MLQVTAVGATEKIRTSVNATATEFTACMSIAGAIITSGGGFGSLAYGGETPSFQLKEVQNYIKAHRNLDSWPLSLNKSANPYANYSVTCGQQGATTLDGCIYGRGFPDIALLGGGVPIVVAGQPQLVGGTSISAPAFAGLVAQINAKIRSTPGLQNKTVRRLTGREGFGTPCEAIHYLKLLSSPQLSHQIGFMNPFLYWAAKKYPKAFRDITKGNNFDFTGNFTQCKLGYYAAPG